MLCYYTTQSTLTSAERVVLQRCQHLRLQNALLSYNPVNTYICRTRCVTTLSTLTSAECIVIIQPSQHLISRTRCVTTQSTLTSAECATVFLYPLLVLWIRADTRSEGIAVVDFVDTRTCNTWGNIGNFRDISRHRASVLQWFWSSWQLRHLNSSTISLLPSCCTVS